ncbi:MAG: 3-hydroxyacyl-CoA dehydrogenase family protein [Ilumatobacteraceae bacterium]
MSASTPDRVLVIGGGTMGRGIALAAVAAGLDTTVVDRDRAVLDAAAAFVVDRAGALADRRGNAAGSFTTAGSIAAAAAEASVVIEAVVERPDVKRAVFSELATTVRPEALLASNTSTLSVTDLAAAAGGSPRVIGMHFFNPAHRMRLVEVVTAPSTADTTLADALALCRVLDKEPVVVADVAGFVTSRLGLLLGNEAMRIVAEGTATAADVDTAMRLGYNHPMGPLELADLVGLDARLNNLRSVAERTGRPEFEPPAILCELVAAGKLGRKSSVGFYRYQPDGAIVDGPRHG